MKLGAADPLTPGGAPVPFFRFEDLESQRLTPHLSTAEGLVIEGRYLYFCKVHKEAGTGSELHYHPNELLIFPLTGKINALVGRDRRVVAPGTFVHAPPFALHSMKATEEGPMDYLYIKDRTWTVVGIAADEAPPERAPSVAEVNQAHQAGRWPGRSKEPEKALGRAEGLGACYHPLSESLGAAAPSGLRFAWVEGERLAFGLFEAPPGAGVPVFEAAHEQFLYVIRGSLRASVGGERREAVPGDVVHVPKGAEGRFAAAEGGAACFAAVRSLPALEESLDRAGAASRAVG